jgi:predicted aminopeptidase
VKQGDDVVTDGVPVYSTLGRLADPLLNTITGFWHLDLAALMFHELAHQVAYLSGDSAFNEAFATVVEGEGVARYAAQLGDPTLLQRWQKRERLQIEITALFRSARADLKQLYSSGVAPEVMRATKAQRLAELGAAIRAVETREGWSSGFGSWIDAGLNNAHLVSVATYYDQVPYFEKLLNEECGGYLPCFYTRVKQEVAARQAAKTTSRR